jgi:hypothetical protein
MVQQSIDVLRWVHGRLDGLKIAQLSVSKRVQLAGACWHVALEHGQAIVMLTEDALHGSALALVRPVFEAYVRGMWLMHCASEKEVDAWTGSVSERLRPIGARGLSRRTR